MDDAEIERLVRGQWRLTPTDQAIPVEAFRRALCDARKDAILTAVRVEQDTLALIREAYDEWLNCTCACNECLDFSTKMDRILPKWFSRLHR